MGRVGTGRYRPETAIVARGRHMRHIRGQRKHKASKEHYDSKSTRPVNEMAGLQPCRTFYASSHASSWHMAGAGGFEPPNAGSKVPCLTAWLRPTAAPRLRRVTILA